MSTAAAAPSFGAVSIRSVSGGHTGRLASTSSTETSLRYMALTLSTAWRWFFALTAARSSTVASVVASSSWAARAK